LRRTTALCLGNSGVEIACLRSAVLQTRHITVACTWLDHGLSLCSAPHHGVCASSNWPGAAIFGCKTCHCARRRPHISHWTSQAAAADLSSLCARRVPTLAQDRAKSQPKPGSVNQPAGRTGNSTARLPRSGEATVILLIAKSSSTWS